MNRSILAGTALAVSGAVAGVALTLGGPALAGDGDSASPTPSPSQSPTPSASQEATPQPFESATEQPTSPVGPSPSSDSEEDEIVSDVVVGDEDECQRFLLPGEEVETGDEEWVEAPEDDVVWLDSDDEDVLVVACEDDEDLAEPAPQPTP